MTSRRCGLVEDGALELLRFHGYSVQVMPAGFNKRFSPAHLVATRPSGETRLIRIMKLSHQSPSVRTVEGKCRTALTQFRKHIALHAKETGFHYEIWCYSLSYGFRCFEIDKENVWEIPKLSLTGPIISPVGGTA